MTELNVPPLAQGGRAASGRYGMSACLSATSLVYLACAGMLAAAAVVVRKRNA